MFLLPNSGQGSEPNNIVFLCTGIYFVMKTVAFECTHLFVINAFLTKTFFSQYLFFISFTTYYLLAKL